MSKTSLDLLKEGRQLLIDKGWTQGTFARNAKGDAVRSCATSAACFCGLGAVRAASKSPFTGIATVAWAEERLEEAAEARGFISFPNFNDHPGRSLEEVLEAFDAAIAAQEVSDAAQ